MQHYDAKLKAMGCVDFREVAATAGSMSLMLVTPEMAARWLGNLYRKQRKENSNARDVYRKSMEMGHWRVSNDAIAITRDGECINGQHRLMAVVENNEPIIAWVLTDADPDMYDIIDNNYSRSAAQVLDCPNRNAVAAMAKALVSIESGESFSKALRSLVNVPRWMITERAESDMNYLQDLVRTYSTVRTQLGRGSGVAYGLAIHTYAAVDKTFSISDVYDFINSADDTTMNLQRTMYRHTSKHARVSSEWVCGTMLKFLEAKASGKQVRQYSGQQSYLNKYEALYREATQQTLL